MSPDEDRVCFGAKRKHHMASHESPNPAPSRLEQKSNVSKIYNAHAGPQQKLRCSPSRKGREAARSSRTSRGQLAPLAIQASGNSGYRRHVRVHSMRLTVCSTILMLRTDWHHVRGMQLRRHWAMRRPRSCEMQERSRTPTALRGRTWRPLCTSSLPLSRTAVKPS